MQGLRKAITVNCRPPKLPGTMRVRPPLADVAEARWDPRLGLQRNRSKLNLAPTWRVTLFKLLPMKVSQVSRSDRENFKVGLWLSTHIYASTKRSSRRPKILPPGPFCRLHFYGREKGPIQRSKRRSRRLLPEKKIRLRPPKNSDASPEHFNLLPDVLLAAA